MAHGQFAYRAAPEVFGGRDGYGPLLVAVVDTSVVIDITAQLDAVDTFGAGVLDPEGWADDTEALADLIAVWFWRDVRFFVPPSILGDAPQGRLRDDRLRSRASAVEAFATDYWQRGGNENGDLDRTLPPAHDEMQLQIPLDGSRGRARPAWPAGFDGQLAREAVAEGCHAIISRDSDITKRAVALRHSGLWAGTPAGLLQELLNAGEFSRGSLPRGPAPDLQTLTTFYSLRAADPR